MCAIMLPYGSIRRLGVDVGILWVWFWGRRLWDFEVWRTRDAYFVKFSGGAIET